jgi:soluble lytic murein transglycosylase-like protein
MANIPQMIADAAARYGVDPQIALEVAIEESSLNQNARGAAGEIGVMQVLPSTAPGVDLTDLQSNINAGVGLLASLLGQFGDPMMAVAAYNCGASRVASAIQRGGSSWLSLVPSSTQAYVAKIFGALGSAYSTAPGPAAAFADAAMVDTTGGTITTVADGVTQVQDAAAGINWGAPSTWALAAGFGLVAFFLLRDVLADA